MDNNQKAAIIKTLTRKLTKSGKAALRVVVSRERRHALQGM
jgi:hypothetical protein